MNMRIEQSERSSFIIRTLWIWFAAGVVMALMAGCASGRSSHATTVSVASQAKSPAPSADAGMAAQSMLPSGARVLLAAAETVEPVPAAPPAMEQGTPSEDYALQPDDVLQITVFEEPDLTTKARVTNTGDVSMPLLGQVKVLGMTLTQAQQHITQLLAADYLVNPQVQVFIESYHPRHVFITGAVNKPGSYPLPTERATTLMEAVTMAGGFTERAALNKTRIIRMEQGQKQTIEVAADDIIKKGDKSKDVTVLPNDIIYVPESFF